MDASNPDLEGVPANAAPTCDAGEMPPPVPCEVPHSSVPSFPEVKQPPLPPDPDQVPLPPDPDEALPPPPPDQAPLPGGPDQALPPLPTSTPPPLPPPDIAEPLLLDMPLLPPWAEGTTAVSRPVPWKSAAEKALPPPWASGTGAAEPVPPWANGTVTVEDLPPHLQKAVDKQPPTLLSSTGPLLAEVSCAREPGVAGKTGKASKSSRPTPRRPWKQATGRRPVPADSQHGPIKSQVQAPEVHTRRAQDAAAPQIADKDAAKESSKKPTSTTKPAHRKTGTNHAVRRNFGRRSSSQERTGDRRRRSPSLGMSLRGQGSLSTSLERRPSERKSADRTHRDTSKRPRRSPSPRRARSRSASLDRRHSNRKSAERIRRDASPRSGRGPLPTRRQERSRTGRDCNTHEKPYSARIDTSRERERQSADRRAASERRHSTRRSGSPDRQRGSGSREEEHLHADKRSPKRPRPRSRSVQRRSSSPQRCETGPGGRPTPKVELLPPPPSRAGRGAAERRDGSTEQRRSGPPSAQQSQSSAPAHDQFNHVLSNGPSGEKAEKRPRLQVSTADLPGPEPLNFVNGGCAVLNQDVGGNQMTAAAQGKAQPGASSQRQAELKRPREPSVHVYDSNADKQQTRAAAETGCKRAAVQKSADPRIAAQTTAPLFSQIAALDKSRQVEWRETQSGAVPAAPPAKQLSSSGSAKAQAHRIVPVADNGNGPSWQAAANRDRRVWVDNEAGQSSEQQYSTEEYSMFASNPGVDRIIHMVNNPTSNGSVENKSKHGGTTTGTGNKQAVANGNNLERLPKELTRRIYHLLERGDLRPEHFTKSIVAKLGALGLPFAHKAVDWILDEDWSTKRSVPSEIGQIIKQAELEANCEG
ncbi:g3328 [Coccomyxa elongata]